MFGAIFSPRFSMKQCLNVCNQSLGGKRVRKESDCPYFKIKSQNLLVIRRFASFFARVW